VQASPSRPLSVWVAFGVSSCSAGSASLSPFFVGMQHKHL